MAQQLINDGDTGLAARTKINENDTELYARPVGLWQIITNKLSNILQSVDYFSLFAKSVEVVRVGDGTNPKVIVDPAGTYGGNTGYWFGSAISGIFANSAVVLRIRINSVDSWTIKQGSIEGRLAGSGALLNETTSAINPSLIPNRSEGATGVGSAGAGQLSLIAGGIEGIRVETIKSTVNGNLLVTGQAHGGDSLESFSASKTFDAEEGNVFEMDVTASTTIGIENEQAGTFIFRLKIDTATPPVITVGSSFGTKLTNASLDFIYVDTNINILTLIVWPSGAKDYTISN